MKTASIILLLAIFVARVVGEQQPELAETEYAYDGGHSDYHSCPRTCVCGKELPFEKLVNKNRCGTPATCAAGSSGYCDNDDVQGVCSPDTCVTPDVAGGLVEACAGYFTVQGGALCMEVICPRDGFITITARAPPLGCCSSQDYLYVYKGDLATGKLVVDNQQYVDYTTDCKEGQNFQVCEKDGFIVTSSVKANFFTQFTGSCKHGYNKVTCHPGH